MDNGAFTIASAATLLDFANRVREGEGLLPNMTWAQQAANIEFPRATSNITLEYQTMDDNVEVKQADVVLLSYPLDYSLSNYSDNDKLLDLDYVRASSVRCIRSEADTCGSTQLDSLPMGLL